MINLRKQIRNHLIIWILIIVYAGITVYSIEEFSLTFILYLLLIIFTPMIIIAYLNRYLVDRFLLKRDFYRYFLSIFISLIIISYTANWYYTSNHNYNNHFFQDLISAIFITIASSAFKFMSEFYRQQLALSETKQKQSEAELKFLKTQINPHFLFNTLNNIYSLSLDRSDKLPESILQLSELMRYILNDSESSLKSIGEEVDFYKSYIELEKLRFSNNIEFSYSENIDEDKNVVAHLILLPFIENLFKHGLKSGSNETLKGSIEIVSKVGYVELKIENLIPTATECSQSIKSGKGIENVKKRLELSYKNRYNLTISCDDKIYKLYLQLEV